MATLKNDILNTILQHCHNGTHAQDAADKVAKLVEEKFTSTNTARAEICAFIDNLPLDKLSEAGWHSTVSVLEEIRRRLSPVA